MRRVVCRAFWSRTRTAVTRWTVAGTNGGWHVCRPGPSDGAEMMTDALRWTAICWGRASCWTNKRCSDSWSSCCLPLSSGRLCSVPARTVGPLAWIWASSDRQQHAQAGMLQSEHVWVDGAQVVHRRHDVAITELFDLDVGRCRHRGGGDSSRHILHHRVRLSRSVHGDVFASWRCFALDRNAVGVSRRRIVFSRLLATATSSCFRTFAISGFYTGIFYKNAHALFDHRAICYMAEVT